MDESLKERQEYLFLTTDNLLHQREAWSNDPSMQGLPTGSLLWMAADQLVTAFETGTIPGSCRNLCLAVEQFSRHWREHVTRAEVSRVDDLLPGNNVWAAIDSISAAREGAMPRPPKLIEPVAVLVKQKVSDLQIAKIYGWRDEFGQYDLVKVRDAIANPGKWDGDVHAKTIQEREQERKLEEQTKLEQLRQRIGKKKNTVPTPGPEPIETLLAQGLNIGQIATAKVIPVAQVLNYCRVQGIALSGNSHSSVVAPAEEISGEDDGTFVIEPDGEDDDPSGPYGEDLSSRFEDDLGGRTDERFDPPEGNPLPMEQQVIHAADNDPKARPGDIGKLLGVSAQKVAAILRRREEIEEPVA